MFIAHAPAGYIAAKFAQKTISKNEFETKLILACGMFFSILPDFDMIYFYTIDNRQNLHHSYWTHIPVFWISCSLLVFLVSMLFRSRTIYLCGLMLMLATMVHLILDSVAGGILWLYPIDSTAYTLIDVPAQYGHWILNFVFHWSFLLELGILALAVIVFLRRNEPIQTSPGRTKAET
ncbi:MAG: metal-dependent hydrolase [Pseudomonadota bacterium]